MNGGTKTKYILPEFGYTAKGGIKLSRDFGVHFDQSYRAQRIRWRLYREVLISFMNAG